MRTYLDGFLMNKSGNTKIAYEFNINQMLDFIGKELNDIEYSDLVEYREHFSTQYSYGSMAQKIRGINSYFSYLYSEREVIDHNPTYNREHKKFAPIKVDGKADKKESKYYSMDEVKMLIDNAKNSRERAILAVYATTGVRVNELINLTLDDYMAGTTTIITKGHKPRTIMFNETAKKYVDEYLKDRKECEYDNLFISNQCTPLRPENLNRTLKNISKRAGLGEDIHNHSLRHSCLSEICKNYDLATAQEFIGHANKMTTQMYVHTNDDRVKNAMMSINF